MHEPTSASSSAPLSHNPVTFQPFLQLPIELRLKIYELALPERVIEIQLKPDTSVEAVSMSLRASDIFPEAREYDAEVDANYPGHKTMISRPVLPSLFHVSREARYTCLESHYRPCHGVAFNSRRTFPFNLFNPGKDTLYVAQSLYNLRAMEQESMWSAPAAETLGTPRPFVLDRLAGESVRDVAKVTSVAISWSDMHLESLHPQLLKSLQKWPNLQHLYLVFFELRDDALELKFMGKMRGKVAVTLVHPKDGKVRGRYGERQLEAKGQLAEELNAEIEAEEAKKLKEDGVRWRGPRVEIRLSRFVELVSAV